MFKPKITSSLASSILGGGMNQFGSGGMPKLTNVSGGMGHPSFKMRVKPIAMASAFPGANKPIAFPMQKLGAYK